MNALELNISDYIISPLFLLLIVGGIIGSISFFFLLRFRETPGVKYWLVWQLAAALWAITYAFEFAATDLETKIIWSKFSYLGIVYCSVSFLFFSLAFSGAGRYLTRRIIVVIYGIATLFLLSPFTNDLHHLHWRSYSINPETNATIYVYGPLFWLVFVFSYLALIGGIIHVVLLFFRSSAYYRKQILLLFIASLIPPLGNLIYVFQVNPVAGFDWTPFTFLLAGILIAINISQFKMFKLAPFARNKLIDIIPDAILVIDNHLRIADYNSQWRRLIDADEDNLTGRLIDEVIPHRQQLINHIISEDTYHAEISKEIDGEMRYFDLHSTTLYDQYKQKTGRLVVIKDITGHVKAEENIRTTNIRLTTEIAEKEKLIADLDAFSHTVAHDLKNMLGAIVTASNLIKNDFDELTKEEILELNELINHSSTKTMHITRELLTLASVRQQEIKAHPVKMEYIVRDSVARMKSMIDEKSAQIILPESWPVALGYEAWIEEVWINYLSNALKYGGTPPVVELGFTILSEQKVKFWIKDNGKGLSTDDMAALFNKFTRLETLRAEGHGLGLSIVKRIVEKLGGEVGVESQNIQGQGSLFFFVLPLA